MKSVCLFLSSALIASSQHLDFDLTKMTPPSIQKSLSTSVDEKPSLMDTQKFEDDVIFRYSKVSYGADIFIGSNQQRMRVALDTSTNLLIVPTSQCDYCEDLSLYNSSESSSSHVDSQTFTINHASLYDHWVSN